ncbi:putative SNF2 helicase [Gregarina niphandrodes]|uniref:SNF2 helicase n=1 Tax=Gregarina niphandrodes TaxID=110365 RepID=A0A023BA00_GRENI|nr:putative SNF2 helicase [Gregarina niphandrodes]EZG77193.1 putative SNF2 helicase [Gregarina niphandrodes]|eukprot:XP_011129529.1 putative SNF2 helicase [Gregarina niphandrodes]
MPTVSLTEQFRINTSVWDTLHDYQKVGVKWLLNNYIGDKGSLLADEMGLGKTLQAIALIAALLDSGSVALTDRWDALMQGITVADCTGEGLIREARCCHVVYKEMSAHLKLFSEYAILVMCPATLLIQWQQEIEHFYPPLKSNVYMITSGEALTKYLTKHRQADAVQVGGSRRLDDLRYDGGIYLTTYEFLRRHQARFRKVPFALGVLDEGHKLKNPNSQLTLAVKSMDIRNRVVLSGTPLQNDLTEFWSLIDFVHPGLLGTLPTFKKYFVFPIDRAGKNYVADDERQKSRECISLLKQLVLPHLFRRTKGQVKLHLPEKTERVLLCPLTLAQYQVYCAFLTIHKVSEQMAQAYARSKGNPFGAGNSITKALAYLSMLIKLCNHPDLILRTVGKPADYGNVERSGKLKILIQLLKTWKKGGHRTLIFSQRIQTLNIIERHLITLNASAAVPNSAQDSAAHTRVLPAAAPFKYYRIDGTVPVKQRIPLIDDFNENNSVFCMLLTTRVGGLGINLTGADRVVIFDPDWNPSVDAQAQERCWRIGQKNSDVKVYRLICQNTIEEKIYKRQIYKSHIANRILKNEDDKVFKPNDFIEMFAHPPQPANSGSQAPLPGDLLQKFVQALKRPDIFADYGKEDKEEPLERDSVSMLPDEPCPSNSLSPVDQSPATPSEMAPATPLLTPPGTFAHSASGEEASGDPVSSISSSTLVGLPGDAPSLPTAGEIDEEVSGVQVLDEAELEREIRAKRKVSKRGSSEPGSSGSRSDKKKRKLDEEEEGLLPDDDTAALATVARQESSSTGEVSDDGEGETGGEEDLLKELCSAGTINSVEEHERLVNESIVIRLTSENRASYAYKAYGALVTSRRDRDAHSWNVPTWTGRHGQAGKPIHLNLATLSMSMKEERIGKCIGNFVPLRLNDTQRKLFVKVRPGGKQVVGGNTGWRRLVACVCL